MEQKIEPRPPLTRWQAIRRSALVKTAIGTLAAVVIYYGLKAQGVPLWGLVRPVLRQVDPMALQSLGLKFVFGVLGVAFLWQAINALRRSQGVTFRDHIWPIIATDPIATAVYNAALLIAMALVIGMALGCGPAHAAVFPSEYDGTIKAASERYLPMHDWRLLKAQYFQESRLKPAARSPVGAEGIAQFMPKTWEEVAKAMGYGLVDRRLAEPSIMGGAFYMARLRKGWFAPRPERSRIRLTQASYNAGAGSLQKAQKLCGNPSRYQRIIRCLPRVTGRFSAETITYVQRIRHWFLLMV